MYYAVHKSVNCREISYIMSGLIVSFRGNIIHLGSGSEDSSAKRDAASNGPKQIAWKCGEDGQVRGDIIPSSLT